MLGGIGKALGGVFDAVAPIADVFGFGDFARGVGDIFDGDLFEKIKNGDILGVFETVVDVAGPFVAGPVAANVISDGIDVVQGEKDAFSFAAEQFAPTLT